MILDPARASSAHNGGIPVLPYDNPRNIATFAHGYIFKQAAPGRTCFRQQRKVFSCPLLPVASAYPEQLPFTAFIYMADCTTHGCF
jgi:hypothetical protein